MKPGLWILDPGSKRGLCSESWARAVSRAFTSAPLASSRSTVAAEQFATAAPSGLRPLFLSEARKAGRLGSTRMFERMLEFFRPALREGAATANSNREGGRAHSTSARVEMVRPSIGLDGIKRVGRWLFAAVWGSQRAASPHSARRCQRLRQAAKWRPRRGPRSQLRAARFGRPAGIANFPSPRHQRPSAMMISLWDAIFVLPMLPSGFLAQPNQ